MTFNPLIPKRRKKVSPQEIRIKIAERPSLYSDTEHSIQISASLSNARSCLIWIYISTYFQYWETDNIIRTIAQRSFSHNYNGQWKTVQDFLESELQNPKQFEEKYISMFGPYEFFGNFLPKAGQFVETIKVRKVTEEKKQKVLYPIYRRGYKDKGTLRLPSNFHGEPPLSPEREDRRNLISHPLLQGEIFFKIEGEAEKLHLKEGGDILVSTNRGH